MFDLDLVTLERSFGGLTELVAAGLPALARGELSAEGSRRTAFITSPYIGGLLWPRTEHKLRIAGGQLLMDD